MTAIGLIYSGTNQSFEAPWGPGERRRQPGSEDDRTALRGFLEGMIS